MTNKTCKECAAPFTSRQYNAEFCGNPCRAAFNNRRMKRGAALYDLLMIEAYDPKSFASQGLEGRVAELIERFRLDDEKAKHTRTWKRPYDVKHDTTQMLR